MPDEIINVESIVVEYLKKNKFDGLCCDQCGCEIDDLFPCSSEGTYGCEPGYKIPCDCGQGCSFHISKEKLTCP